MQGREGGKTKYGDVARMSVLSEPRRMGVYAIYSYLILYKAIGCIALCDATGLGGLLSSE